jgi:(1->4)-alpha-D-glucan 1-alpha-D-glucosylmutase
MRVPVATYRIQFNPGFDFTKFRNWISYLADLGISDIYASPIFEARKGSQHGYDVVNPAEINPELGGREVFDELSREIKNSGMGWIQDIVPNHMAYDYDNRMLMDVLERGENSNFFRFFDIDWAHRFGERRGILLAPFLGKIYRKCLEDQEIHLSFHEGEIRVNYFDLKFPLFKGSYGRILRHRLDQLKMCSGKGSPIWQKFSSFLSVLESEKEIREKRDNSDESSFKEPLAKICKESKEVKKFILENIRIFNGIKGNPDSFTPLDNLLSEQLFRLSFWKVATEEINYRRFFNVNELICMRTEDKNVFDHIHSLVFSLIDEGKFTGLRIDHIDGLYDPTGYLKRLRRKGGEIFLVVEKILQPEEDLLPEWPVQGTTGYEWLNLVNSLFCNQKYKKKLDRIYSKFSGSCISYDRLVSDKKRLIIGQHMAGDIDNLARSLKKLSFHSREGLDLTLYGLRRAIVEVMAQFPVYRTYIAETLLREKDIAYIREAADKARKRIPGFLHEVDFVERILLDRLDSFFSGRKRHARDFAMRFQQFTGPLMAKGFEDTVLYVYNRLLSLNEVGGSPDRFGVPLEPFHRFCKKRAELWPHSMNPTTTHDTKRGEDVRARLNVLSEIPEEWDQKVSLWNRLNRRKKRRVNGERVPERNDEYFLYQTLVGALPFQQEEYSSFIERMKGYIVKSVREAKVHTGWIEPDLAYEEAYVSFMEDILDHSGNNPFLREFLPFQRKIAHYGIFNSLSQTLLKCSSPGIPDIYQGSELWDLNLVDPDNRRPVDFWKRRKFLGEVKSRERENGVKLAKDLLQCREDGRLKLFLIYKALKARRQSPGVFEKGTYIPIRTNGKWSRHIIAFARNADGSWMVSIAPRFLTPLIDGDSFPLGPHVWEDTSILLPEECPPYWRDMFLDRIMRGERSLRISDVLKDFPVALLMNTEKG